MKNPIVEQQKFDFVDALRGYAIVGVLLIHVSQYCTGLSDIFLILSGSGRYGVQLFFIASAFTLSLSHNNRRRAEERPITNFFIRRFFRIAPLYYMGLIIYFVLRGLYKHAWPPPQYDLPMVLSNIFFVHGLHPTTINYAVPGGWSIGTEFIFYMFFPFLISKITSIRKAVIFLFLSIGLAVVFYYIWALIYKENCDLNGFRYYTITNNLPSFMLGILLYHLWNNKESIMEMFKLKAKVFSMILLLLCCIMFIIGLTVTDFYLSLIASPLIMGFAFLFFSLSLSLYKTVIVNKPICYIGKISFSLYIMHFIFAWYVVPKIMKTLSLNINGNILFIISVLLTLGLAVLVSSITYKYIEERGMKVGKDLIKRINS